MRAAQDAVFDRVYWRPAVEVAVDLGLRTNLGYLVIYDTSIHSGGDGITTSNTTADAVWNIRKRFAAGPPGELPEGADRAAKRAHRDAEAVWVKAYVDARGAWLRSFAEGSPVYVSAYRCDALARLVSAGNWRLQTPLEVVLPHKTVRL